MAPSLNLPSENQLAWYPHLTIALIPHKYVPTMGILLPEITSINRILKIGIIFALGVTKMSELVSV
jgi:hypothetical protein